ALGVEVGCLGDLARPLPPPAPRAARRAPAPAPRRLLERRDVLEARLIAGESGTQPWLDLRAQGLLAIGRGHRPRPARSGGRTPATPSPPRLPGSQRLDLLLERLRFGSFPRLSLGGSGRRDPLPGALRPLRLDRARPVGRQPRPLGAAR